MYRKQLGLEYNLIPPNLRTDIKGINNNFLFFLPFESGYSFEAASFDSYCILSNQTSFWTQFWFRGQLPSFTQNCSLSLSNKKISKHSLSQQ